MKPIDFRNETFADIRSRIDKKREVVLDAMFRLGPRTTRSLALEMGMDVVDVRPRVTELYQIGAVELIGRQGRDGVYAARKEGDWIAWFDAEERAATQGDQMLLRI